MAPNSVESEMLSADAVPMCRVSFSCGIKVYPPSEVSDEPIAAGPEMLPARA